MFMHATSLEHVGVARVAAMAHGATPADK